jgi:uncharacterized protein YidB (DUF937 family)
MSIFDTFASALGGSGTTAGKFTHAAIELIQGGSHGGLDGLLERFRASGLSQHVDSWISTGHNLPISADDIQRVLGSGQVAELARKAGIDPAIASQELAQILPQIVDKLTPHGQMPSSDLVSNALSMLKGKIGMI